MKRLISICTIFMLSNGIANAQTLNINETIQKAVTNSYELKMAKADINISKASLKEVKADYYPEIKSGLYSQYVYDLANKNIPASYIGNTLANQATNFQDYLSVNLNYNLFDFGVRGQKVLNAKKDIESKTFTYKQSARDLKLNIIQLYTDALLSYKEIKLREDVLTLYKDLFEMKEKLYLAGNKPKVELMDEAVNIAKTKTQIDQLKTKLKSSLKDLSSYTSEKYDINKLDISDFEEDHFIPVSYTKDNKVLKQKIEKKVSSIPELNLTNTPENKMYDAEIAKKKTEIEVLKRQRYPAFSFFSSYGWYGSDVNNPMSSIGNIKNSNLSLGISTSLPIFDGFKNRASREKTQYQIDRLVFEKDKKILDLKTKYEKLHEGAQSLQTELQDSEELLAKIEEKLNAVERLINQKITDKTAYLEQKAELVNQKIELEKSITNSLSTVKQLEILSED